MTDLVTFTEHRAEDGYFGARIEAHIGKRLVGIIVPMPRLQWYAASYQIYLPIDGGVPFSRHASSITAARRQLLQWLSGWFVDAGEGFESIADAIAVQALEEKDGGSLVPAADKAGTLHA